MRYIPIAYKWGYFLGVTIQGVLLLAYSVFVNIIIKTVDVYTLLALSCFGAVWFVSAYYFNKGLVYLTLDKKEKKVIIGNVFFKNEANYDQISIIRKLRYPNMFRVVISDKRFKFSCQHFKYIKEDLTKELKFTKFE